MELRPALLRGAEERFGSLGLTNIHTRLGDGRRGWPDAAPFEAIVTAAASAAPPEALLGQLSAGGRIVLPIGPPDGQRLIRVRRTLDGGFAFDGGIPVCFVALHPSDVTPRG